MALSILKRKLEIEPYRKSAKESALLQNLTDKNFTQKT